MCTLPLVQASQGLGFTAEAVDEFGVFGEVFAKDFDGHLDLASEVEGQVDIGHAPRPRKDSIR